MGKDAFRQNRGALDWSFMLRVGKIDKRREKKKRGKDCGSEKWAVSQLLHTIKKKSQSSPTRTSPEYSRKEHCDFDTLGDGLAQGEAHTDRGSCVRCDGGSGAREGSDQHSANPEGQSDGGGTASCNGRAGVEGDAIHQGLNGPLAAAHGRGVPSGGVGDDRSTLATHGWVRGERKGGKHHAVGTTLARRTVHYHARALRECRPAEIRVEAVTLDGCGW